MKITKKLLSKIITEELEKHLREAENEEQDLLEPATDEFDELDSDPKLQEFKAAIDSASSVNYLHVDTVLEGLENVYYEMHKEFMQNLEEAGMPEEALETVAENLTMKIFWKNMIDLATRELKELKIND